MTNQHPITPPPELVRQWYLGAKAYPPDQIVKGAGWWVTDVANQAAQWGANQELEACIAFVRRGPWCSEKLRAARRPKPPSLKEQALEALDDAVMRGDCISISDALPTLRRALEALND